MTRTTQWLAGIGALCVLYAQTLRPRILTWGATAEEAAPKPARR